MIVYLIICELCHRFLDMYHANKKISIKMFNNLYSFIFTVKQKNNCVSIIISAQNFFIHIL